MAVIPSNILPLGAQAPDFNLLDPCTDKKVSLAEVKSDSATVIMFICNHCPFVKHTHHELVNLASDYRPKGVGFVAINSNDVEHYPKDSHERMKTEGYPFPYLYDETQQVAKAYKVTYTPDFYIFDKGLKCVYHGQLDDSRPGNDIPVTGKDIREALDAILAGNAVTEQQKPSTGCNIKWKE